MILSFLEELEELVISQERDPNNALKRLILYVEELGDNIRDYRIIIGHTDSLDLASKLAEILKEKFDKNLIIEYVVVNPTAKSHCESDAVGICFHAKRR